MDTQTQVILFHGLSLAKKHFKPKTIEVMVATTPPLMQDRKLPSSTYRYVHVHSCKASCTKHVGDFRGRLENFFIVFKGKQRIICKIHVYMYYTNYTFLSLFCLLGYKVITVFMPINVFQIYMCIPCNKCIVCFIHKL